jgi:hypothetical protein
MVHRGRATPFVPFGRCSRIGQNKVSEDTIVLGSCYSLADHVAKSASLLLLQGQQPMNNRIHLGALDLEELFPAIKIDT